jgi:hypothetical protein
MTKQLKHRLTVKHAYDGYVVCTGVFLTADGKGWHHDIVGRMVHHAMLKPKQLPRVGDVIHEYDDGSLEHRPAVLNAAKA